MKCQAPNCSEEATLHCPKCLKLGIEKSLSAFCGQKCFKECWPQHKALHKIAIEQRKQEAAQQLSSAEAAFDGYEFTGPLRPGKVSPMMTVPAHIPLPDYAHTGRPISEEKARGTRVSPASKKSIQKMRVVCKFAAELLQMCGAMCQPGVTGDQLDRAVFAATVERGGYPSPLNYRGFPKSLCVSANEIICHGIPDDRPFEEGDIINCDITVYLDGHHGDCNATFFVGKCDEESKKLVECARKCLADGIKAVRPNVLYREIGKVVSKTAAQANCSVVKSYCGHGIGTLFHTAPNVPHYAKNKAIGTMKAGHIFTIEPMINAGSWQDDLWPDDWSAPTADGKRSAQFEHTMVVTSKGVEVLTQSDGWDVVRNPPPEAKDHTGKTRVKCPPHLAKYARAEGVEVDVVGEEPTRSVETKPEDTNEQQETTGETVDKDDVEKTDQ